MNLEVIGSVRGKSVGFSFVEDICEVVVFFRDGGKVNWRRVGLGRGSSGDVFELKREFLCTW